MRASRLRAGALLTVGLLLTAACTSGNPSSGSSGGGGGGGGTHTTLNAVMAQEATELSPLTATQQGKAQVLSLLGTPLLQSDDQAKVFSRLLTSWDPSSDATTVTFKLKPNLVWSDGQPITSADIVTTLNIYLDSAVSASAGRIGGVEGQDAVAKKTATTVSGVTAPDASTVVVKLATPNVAWTANIAAVAFNLPLLPDHVLGKVPHDQLKDNAYFKTYPVSSGPFKLTAFAQGQSAQFVRNDSYFGTKPSFEKVNLKALATDVTSAQLQTGETDFIFPVDPADVQRISAIDGVAVLSHQGVAPELLALNYASPKLKDPRIRQAMIYAIDRAGICKQVLAGQCTTPLTNIRQISPAWSIPTTGVTSYDYNPTKAKELLAEAGWNPSTQLILLTRTGRSYVDKAMTILQGQLAAVGVNVTLQNVDTGQLLDTWKKQDDSWQAAWNSGADFTLDPIAMQTYAICSARYPAGGNTSQYCNPDVDVLFAKGATQTDQTERGATYQQIFTKLSQDPSEIYLYVVNSISAFNKKIAGIKAHGNLSQPYWNIEDWNWQG
jgi:peptide/nickel transport system substrate-binding protein